MATDESSGAPGYVVIGHLSVDLVDGQERPGGSVFYSGVTAARLGKRVGIVTARHGHLPRELDGIAVEGVDSDAPTSLKLTTTTEGRSLRLLSRAVPVTAAAIPAVWRSASLVHLAPIVDEVPLDLGASFHRARLLATPQGWLRRWDANGWVSSWAAEDRRLHKVSPEAFVLSLEDLGGKHERARDLARWARVVVVTEGARGCWVLSGESERHLPAFPTVPIDTIGAGDVFAAAFFVRLTELEDPWEAARFASVAAALSLRAPGVAGVPDRSEVLAVLRSWVTAS